MENRKRKKSTVELLDLQAAQEKNKTLENDIIGKDEAQSEIKDIRTVEESDADKDVDPIADDARNFEAINFQILGEDVDKNKPKRVSMVLPSWLAHPTIISTAVAPKVRQRRTKLLLISLHFWHHIYVTRSKKCNSRGYFQCK